MYNVGFFTYVCPYKEVIYTSLLQTSEASKSRELSNQIEELQKDLEDSKDEQQRLTSELDGKQFGIQRLETQVQSLVRPYGHGTTCITC